MERTTTTTTTAVTTTAPIPTPTPNIRTPKLSTDPSPTPRTYLPENESFFLVGSLECFVVAPYDRLSPSKRHRWVIESRFNSLAAFIRTRFKMYLKNRNDRDDPYLNYK